MTLRDDAWSAIFLTLTKQNEFKLTDLPFKESEMHTVRRVAREMEQYRWIQRESPQHARWTAGPRFKDLAAVADERLEAE